MYPPIKSKFHVAWNRHSIQKILWLFLLLVTVSSGQAQDENSNDPVSTYEQELFGNGGLGPLESYWAQWRVGAPLVSDLLDHDERNQKIAIAVMDDSISREQPALQSVLRRWLIDDPSPKLSHGTQVASIFCSESSCSVGNAAQADLWFYSYSETNPFLNKDQSTTVILRSIQDAIENKVRIINISLSFFQTIAEIDKLKILDLIQKNNVIIVWSAGNDAITVKTAHPNLFSIASVDPFLEPSSFSNFGKAVAFAAPSDHFIHALNDSSFGGTSGAAPVIAGVILNILKVAPNLTVEEVKKVLQVSALDLGAPGFDEKTGWGMPNLPAAIYLARLVKYKNFKFSNDLDQDRFKLNKILEKKYEPLSYKEVFKSDHYVAGVKKIFLNYFYHNCPETRMQVYLVYRHHHFLISAAYYRDDKDIQKELLEEAFTRLPIPIKVDFLFKDNAQSERLDLKLWLAKTIGSFFGFNDTFFNETDNDENSMAAPLLSAYDARARDTLKKKLEDFQEWEPKDHDEKLLFRSALIRRLAQQGDQDVVKIIKKDIASIFYAHQIRGLWKFQTDFFAIDIYCSLSMHALVEILGEIQTEESEKLLLAIFESGYFIVDRMTTDNWSWMNNDSWAISLKKIAEHRKDFLVALLQKDIDPGIKNFIAFALTGFWTVRDIPFLISSLKESISNQILPTGFLYALGGIGKAHPFLIAQLASYLTGEPSQKLLQKEDRKRLRQEILFTLGKIIGSDPYRSSLAMQMTLPLFLRGRVDPDPEFANIAAYFYQRLMQP
ncbi:MAG: S8/S53 family peptidase [Deltaproteobacteria bacterium]|nr:S8/S53 family peptidase [Deltaproteobacteria bacterium]